MANLDIMCAADGPAKCEFGPWRGTREKGWCDMFNLEQPYRLPPGAVCIYASNCQDFEWTDAQYVARARLEPERVAFWKQYFDTELEVAKAVCDNPPSFDAQWKESMGSPAKYKKDQAALKEEIRHTASNRQRDAMPSGEYGGVDDGMGHIVSDADPCL